MAGMNVECSFAAGRGMTTTQIYQTQAHLAKSAARRRDTLRGAWQDILRELDGKIPASHMQIARSITLDIPLHAKRGGPINAFASIDPPRIEISLATLQFLDDIFTALSWRDINGCHTDAVLDYVAMVRLRRIRHPRGAKFPPQALMGVPTAGYNDPSVAKAAGLGMTNAVTFLLAHELAHIVLGHGRDAGRTQEQLEYEADTYALTAMKNIGVVPVGASISFLILGAYDEGQDPSKRSHPTFMSRARRIAKLARRSGATDVADWVETAAYLRREVRKLAYIRACRRPTKTLKQCQAWSEDRVPDGINYCLP